MGARRAIVSYLLCKLLEWYSRAPRFSITNGEELSFSFLKIEYRSYAKFLSSICVDSNKRK